MKGLHEFKLLIESLRLTNSRNDKKEILQHVSDEVETLALLKVILDPFKKFYVTKDSILKYEQDQGLNKSGFICTSMGELAVMLETLASRKVTGHDALNWCLATIKNNTTGDTTDCRDILLSIFDKDLKIGIGATDINKVWKNFVPTYDVCLAQKTQDPKDPDCLQKYLDKINAEPEKWCIQRKLDGLRCIIEYQNGKAVAKSRNGLEFPALKKLTDAFEQFIDTIGHTGQPLIFDGEVCVVDEEGNEDFSAAVSQVKRKSAIMENPKFIMFDMMTLEDFQNKSTDEVYWTRADAVRLFCDQYAGSLFESVDIWDYNEKNFDDLMKMSKDKGWEGLMLRKNVGYEGKRTKNLLKVKRFEVEEYVVDSINIDVLQMNDPETGLRRDEETFKSVNITHKGNTVNVGTGWSQEQRRAFYKDQTLIVGKTISVQFQEESQDKKTGLFSLRIPSVVHIWEASRDV